MLPTFEETARLCINTPEFLAQYRRLTGAKLGAGSALEQAIDRATGYDEVEATAMFEFIRDYVWLPVVEALAREGR